MRTFRRRKFEVSEYSRMRVGRAFWGVTFETARRGECKMAVQTYLHDLREMLEAGKGLLLWGEFRSGKTSLAVVIMRETVRWGATTMLLKAPEWTAVTPAPVMFDESQTLEARAFEVDLLVLDDLGLEHDSPWAKTRIEQLVRNRVEQKRSLVVTTNLAPQKLTERYGEGLVSVFKEVAYPVRVYGDWGKRRAQALARRMEEK